MASPSDGSVEISSEKVDQGELSSIDGYDSKNGGYDFAVAFEGDSEYVRVDLTVSGRGVDGVEYVSLYCTVIVSYGVACWDVQKKCHPMVGRVLFWDNCAVFIDRLIF